MKKLVLLAALLMSSAAQAYDWGPASLRVAKLADRLNDDDGKAVMEQEVINAVGYLPNKAEVSTCGGAAGSKPWECKILTWGDYHSGRLVVYFMHSTGGCALNPATNRDHAEYLKLFPNTDRGCWEAGWYLNSWRVH
jgi:hypothetical protein